MSSVKDGASVPFKQIARAKSAVYHTLREADASAQGNKDGRTSLPELRGYRAALDATLQSGVGYDPKDTSTWLPAQFELRDRIRAVDRAIDVVERDGDKPPKTFRQRALEIVTAPLGWLIGLLFRQPPRYWG